MRHSMRALGLMSGTSADGVDALLLELDHPDQRHCPRVLGHAYRPFPDELRNTLRAPEQLRVPEISELSYALSARYAETVKAIPQWETADVCGMHGQTVWHRPPSQAKGGTAHTLQIGSSGALAQALGLPVVGDMRAADLALGGEGAPIAPLSHWMFTPVQNTGRLVVNVGGIANSTFVAERQQDVLASDIGPGMMITDALAHHVSQGRAHYDHDGELSKGGRPDPAFVEYVLAHPFFSRALPRSTGREDFGASYVQTLLERFGTLAPADLITSALEVTARAIAAVATGELTGVTEIVLTGGGALHPRIVGRVEELVPCPVVVHTEGALAPQHHEPAAMALIAARTLHRLPSGLPGVTGASRPAILGHVHWPTPND